MEKNLCTSVDTKERPRQNCQGQLGEAEREVSRLR